MASSAENVSIWWRHYVSTALVNYFTPAETQKIAYVNDDMSVLVVKLSLNISSYYICIAKYTLVCACCGLGLLSSRFVSNWFVLDSTSFHKCDAVWEGGLAESSKTLIYLSEVGAKPQKMTSDTFCTTDHLCGETTEKDNFKTVYLHELWIYYKVFLWDVITHPCPTSRLNRKKDELNQHCIEGMGTLIARFIVPTWAPSGADRNQGAISIRKTVLPGMAIPMLKIRRPNGRLIFNMEIAIRR